MGLSVEKITTFFAYWLAVGLAYFGAMSPEKLALYVGSACAIFTALTNYWFKRKTYRYLNMFNDGLSYMGVVESVTLPKLTRKLEKYRGGGMPGAVSVDLGLDDDALSLEWTLGGLPDIELWAQYASPGADSVPLRFTGSYQRDDTGAISAVEVVMRGRHKEYDGGENKQGESGTTKMATECAYYQLTIDGKEVIEIDVINMVLKVDGVDRMAEHRKVIGL